jgi:hypothetical protein
LWEEEILRTPFISEAQTESGKNEKGILQVNYLTFFFGGCWLEMFSTLLFWTWSFVKQLNPNNYEVWFLQSRA